MKKHIPISFLCTIALLGQIACKSNGTSNISGPGSGTNTSGGGTGQQTSQDPQTGGHFLHNFPKNQIVSGGVDKDGIPALTDPEFVPVTSPDAAYVRDDDLVLGVVIGNEARAYPHNVGWWHEIVNDVIGGQPIVVSFCPLTSTGLVFNGGAGAQRLTCGVSGLLFNNNLIMYDRRDGRTLYPQMLHIPIDGGSLDGELQLMPVIETTWRFWKQIYPNSKVISSNAITYSQSRYQTYPYGNYRSPTAPPMFPSFPRLSDNTTAQRFPPKTMTLGIRFDEIAKAYPFPSMRDEAVINDTLAGHSILVVFYAAEQYAVPFSRQRGNQTLTFDKIASASPMYPFMMKDRETGSVWNLKGEAIEGALAGQKLDRIPAHNAFWFAWATFWRNTGIY